jgi:hypothetical protein
MTFLRAEAAMPSGKVVRSRGAYASDEERFFSYVEETPACWLWIGSTTKDGYGQFGSTRFGTVSAHRFSFYVHNGVWPSGDVCHSRDCERNCVNPSHLRDGTHAENMREIPQHRRELINENSGLRIEIDNLKLELRLLEVENLYLESKLEKMRDFIDELIKLGRELRQRSTPDPIGPLALSMGEVEGQEAR